MKNLTLFILMLTTSVTLIAQTLPLQVEWTNMFNRRTAASDYLIDMAVGIKGGIYLAGDSYDVGWNGMSRLQIVKYDENGNLIWEKIHNGIDSTKRKVVQEIKIIDETQLFVSGVVIGNPTVHLLLAKYNIAGNLIWSMEKDAIHPGVPFSYKFQVTNQGNIYLIYDQGGTYPTQAINIVKLNSNAQLIWERNYSYNSTSLDYVKSFEVDEAENIYLTGSTSQYDSTFVGFNEFDTFISKFDSSGQLIRQQTYCPTQSCTMKSIQTDDKYNSYLILNSYQNQIDSTYLIKIDSSGMIQFTRNFSSDTLTPFLSTCILKNGFINTYVSIDNYHARTQWVLMKKYDLEDSLCLVSDTIHLSGNNVKFGIDNWGNNYAVSEMSSFYSKIGVSISDTNGMTTNYIEYQDTSIGNIYTQKIHIKDDGVIYVGATSTHAIVSHRAFYLMKYNYTDTTNNYVIIDTKPIEKEKIKIELYPNPVRNISNIKIGVNAENTEVQIVNTLGQIMPKPLKISNQHFEIHQRNYPSGIYYYTIKANNKLIYSSSFHVY